MKTIIGNFLGCKTYGDLTDLTDSQASQMQDMVIYPGKFRTRPGYYKYTTTQMVETGDPVVTSG